MKPQTLPDDVARYLELRGEGARKAHAEMLRARFGVNLADFMARGTVIRAMATDTPMQVVRYSKNLRGLRDHARVSRVACVIAQRDQSHEHRGSHPRGVLHVVYRDGSIGRASFASYSIMIDWIRNRRSWRQWGAVFRILDEDIGYLTRPGIIAGAAK